MTSPSLLIAGLGAGRPQQLTVEVRGALADAALIFARTGDVITPYRGDLSAEIVTFEDSDSRRTQGSAIVDAVAAAVIAGRNAVYAVPGDGVQADGAVPLLRRRLGAAVRIFPGVSLAASTLEVVDAVGARWLQVLSGEEIERYGEENAVGETPNEPAPLPWRAPVPTEPMIVTGLDGTNLAAGSRWLSRFYGPEHRVQLVHFPSGERIDTQLSALEGQAVNAWIVLYLPPMPEMENVRTFSGMMQLTRRLRGPDGCPWDREQTHATLKTYLLEEAYEVLDALDSGDPAAIAEEFGDLLYQITLHAQVAAEAGAFTIEDVIGHIVTKLIGRHPHVFGDLDLASAQDVRNAWESFKQRQKPRRSSIFEGIPRGLPALPQSNLMQKRAASVGFEWTGVDETLDKVREEVEELREAIATAAPNAEQRGELGDLLFALVSVARLRRIDPEEALRDANRKFAERFQYVERRAAAEGRSMRDISPETLRTWWEDAKTAGIGA